MGYPITTSCRPTWIDADFYIESYEAGAERETRERYRIDTRLEHHETAFLGECSRIEKKMAQAKAKGEEWYPVVVLLTIEDSDPILRKVIT